MPNENDIGGRVGLDVTDFKAGIAELNRQIKVIDSGFKAAAAGMEDWGKSEEGLQQRIKSLNDITDLQRQKIANLTEQYKKIASEKGESSKAAQDLQVRINKETESLNKNISEMNRATSALNNLGNESKQAASKTKELDKSVEDARNGLRDLGGNVAKAAAVGIAALGAAIVGAITGTFKLAEKASDLSEAQNVVKETFDNTSQSIIDWSKTVDESAGISETNAVKFAGSMGAMLKSSGLTEQAAGDMSKSLVQLTGDMSSFYNLGHDEMWEKIRSGISGETEPLKQLGINMSVANMEAFALSKGINKAWNEMSQAEQTTLRYQYLMQTTADAQGDFGRTLETSFSNQLRVAQMQLETTATSIGQKFLPAFTEVAKSLNESLRSQEFSAALDSIANGLAGIAEKAVQSIPAIVDGLGWIVNNAGTIAAGAAAIGAGMLTWNVVTTIQSVVKAIQAWQVATQGLTIAQAALNLMMSLNPVGLIVTAIAALVAGIIVLWNTNDGFRNAVIGAWEAIKSAGVAVWDWLVKFFTVDIPQAFNTVISFFENNWKEILLFITNPIAGALAFLYKLNPQFKAWVDGVWNTIVNTLKELPSKIAAFFNELPEKIGYAFGLVIGTLAKFAVDAFNWVTTEVPKIISDIVTFFSELPGKIGAFFTQVINDFGAWSVKASTLIATNVPNLINSIVNFFAELPGKIWGFLSNVLQKISQWISNATSTVQTEVPKITNSIVSFFEELPGKMLDIGRRIVEGLWDGIRNAGSWLQDKISDYADGIIRGFKKSFDIHSPSAIMRDEVGLMIGAGMAEGIADSTKMVNAAMKQLNKQVSVDPVSFSANGGVGSSRNPLSSGSSGNIYLNVTGNTITSPADEDRLVDKISLRLAGQFGLSVGGSF